MILQQFSRSFFLKHSVEYTTKTKYVLLKMLCKYKIIQQEQQQQQPNAFSLLQSMSLHRVKHSSREACGRQHNNVRCWTLHNSKPWEMFCPVMKPETRWCTGPASPQWGLSTRGFKPRELDRYTPVLRNTATVRHRRVAHTVDTNDEEQMKLNLIQQ